jgi:hypothetical protein
MIDNKTPPLAQLTKKYIQWNVVQLRRKNGAISEEE